MHPRRVGAKLSIALILVLVSPLLTLEANGASLYTFTSLGNAMPVGIDGAGDVALGYSNGVYHSYGPSAGQITPLSAYLPTTPSNPNEYEPSPLIYGITDSGVVFGSMPVGQTWHAFTSGGGQFTDLGLLPGTTQTTAGAMNNSGVVVGYALALGDTGGEGFVYQNGHMTPFLPGGSLGAAPTAINDGNALTGGSMIAGNYSPNGMPPYQAILSQNGNKIYLGTLGGNQSLANGINNDNQIVGSSTLTGNLVQHAFLYSNGVMQDLGTLPGRSSSEAMAINDFRQVVGDSSGHAFLWQNGVMYDLNNLLKSPAPFPLEYATGINNSGQIIGYSLTGSGYAAFLLTPDDLPPPAPIPPAPSSPTVPEPGTLAIWGAIGMACVLRRFSSRGTGRSRRGVSVRHVHSDRFAGLRPW